MHTIIQRDWLKRAHWHDYLLPLGIVTYWLLLAMLYPSLYSMVDERQYLAKAYQIASGDSFQKITEPEDAWIEKYPPGQPLMLAVFLNFGHHFVYLLNPIFFTMLVLLFSWYLKQFRLPNYLALLLLFNPTFFIFSRTIMSDIPAVFFLFLGIRLSLYPPNSSFLAGVFLGFSSSIRVAYLPLSLFCTMYVIWKEKWNYKSIVKIGTGLLIGSIPLLYYVHRSITTPEFGYANDFKDINNNIISFFPYLAYYLLSLNLIYPLMMVIGLTYKFEKQYFFKLLAILPFFIMPVMPIHPSHPENTIFSLIFLRQRYFLVSIIVFLFGYILFVHRRYIEKPLRCLPIIILLFIGCTIISVIHQNWLSRNIGLQKNLYEATSENALIISDDRPEKLIQDLFGKRKVLNVEVIYDKTEIFKKIDAFHSGDVYVIYTENSVDEHSTQMLQSILDQYPSKMVVHYQNFIIFALIL